MLVKNTQEISKHIENSNMPPEIKELLLAKVLDESIPSLLPETKLDLDNNCNAVINYKNLNAQIFISNISMDNIDLIKYDFRSSLLGFKHGYNKRIIELIRDYIMIN